MAARARARSAVATHFRSGTSIPTLSGRPTEVELHSTSSEGVFNLYQELASGARNTKSCLNPTRIGYKSKPPGEPDRNYSYLDWRARRVRIFERCFGLSVQARADNWDDQIK